MAATPQFVSVPNVKGTKFVNSDGTSVKTVFTPGSSGSRIDKILITSDNSANIAVILSIVQSAVVYKILRILVPAAGTSSPLVTLNALDYSSLPWSEDEQVSLILPNGTTLQAEMSAAVASTKTVDIVVLGGDF